MHEWKDRCLFASNTMAYVRGDRRNVQSYQLLQLSAFLPSPCQW